MDDRELADRLSKIYDEIVALRIDLDLFKQEALATDGEEEEGPKETNNGQQRQNEAEDNEDGNEGRGEEEEEEEEEEEDEDEEPARIHISKRGKA